MAPAHAAVASPSSGSSTGETEVTDVATEVAEDESLPAERILPTEPAQGGVQVDDAPDVELENLPRNIITEWEGDEADLTPVQLSEIEAAGVDMSTSSSETAAPIAEQIPNQLLTDAGPCPVAIGEDVLAGLEACAEDRADSDLQDASSLTRSATSTDSSPSASADSMTTSASIDIDGPNEDDVSAEEDEEDSGIGAVSGSVYFPTPDKSPCIVNWMEQLIFEKRTQACFSYDVAVTVWDPNTNSSIGGYMITVLVETVTNNVETELDNYTSLRKSDSYGVAVGRGVSVQGKYKCATYGCTTSNNTSFLRTTSGPWVTAHGYSRITLEKGESTPVREGWSLEVRFPGYGGYSPLGAYETKPRCDWAAGGNSGRGCVFAKYEPWFKTPASGETAEAGKHIVAAVGTLLPTTLTRVSKEEADRNRRNVCPDSLNRWNKTLSCDEYPFASTAEGGNPNVRVPQGCRWAEKKGRGMDGTSRCLILLTHNMAAGRLLGTMYKTHRIQAGDRFYVAT